MTRLAPGYDRAALEGLALHAIPATMAPRYANSYDAHGERRQLLLSPGERLDLSGLAFDTPADALIVAPAYHEFEVLPGIAAPVLAVSLQGILRAVDSRGHVYPAPDPAGSLEPFIRPGSFAFFSEEDTEDATGLAAYVASRGATALLTRGYRGATLVEPGRILHLDAVPATAIDPTGAGDCFAAGFVVRFVETGDIAAACAFALAAGALAVEGRGLAGIPTRAQVEARLGRVAA